MFVITLISKNALTAVLLGVAGGSVGLTPTGAPVRGELVAGLTVAVVANLVVLTTSVYVTLTLDPGVHTFVNICNSVTYTSVNNRSVVTRTVYTH